MDAMKYTDYEKEVKTIQKENEEYLQAFQDDLKAKNLSDKTIEQHINNMDFYLNEYLVHYTPLRMVRGVHEIDGYLGNWFIRKCLWSSASSIKGTAASIKKFYKCMLEHQFIEKDDYDFLCFVIKEEMETWLDHVHRYDAGDIDWIYEW